MKTKNLLIMLSLLPVMAFASTGGDTTFDTVTTQLTDYLTGSLGMMLVMFGFIGAACAIAGFGPMKLLFPIFGLTLCLHYGPAILKTVFGASGDYNQGYLHHARTFDLYDLAVILAAAAVFVVGYYIIKKRKSK